MAKGDSGRKPRYDFQYSKQVKSHLDEIEGKRSESMITVAKADVDKFPHQCRYYKPCNEIVNNPQNNYNHFKQVHPWTDDERAFLLTLFDESPNNKNVYILSALYGRSEEALCAVFKAQNRRIPRWSHKEKEIADVHELINNDIQTLRADNRVRVSKAEQDKQIDAYLDKDNEASVALLNPFPISVETIQTQDYLNPPHPIGSRNFYKHIVDALLEKHKYWTAEEQRLKNRIQELDNQNSELKNKLAEKMDETPLSEDDDVEHWEQLNQIYIEYNPPEF